MLIDLVAGDSFGRFNRKLAKLAGLQTAVYWSELLNVITRVVKKKTYDQTTGFFTVNRTYIESQCTISLEDQLICDQALVNLGIVDVDPEDKNKLRVNLDNYAAIVIDDDIKKLKKEATIAKVSKKDKAESKRVGIITRMCSRIRETDPELVNAYDKYCEVLYSLGVMTNAQVDAMQEALNKFTDDKQTKLEILQIAVLSNYRNIEWAIERFSKSNKTSAVKIAGEQKIASKVKDDVEF